jgi:hypothetical protein
MVRTIVYLFVGVVVLGTIAAPGLAAFALVLAPLLGVWFLWRIALTISTRGHSTEAVVRTRTSHLLGPGGPDDSFAASPFSQVEYLAQAPARASVSARNGSMRGAHIPRPGASKTLPVRPRVEDSLQGGNA